MPKRVQKITLVCDYCSKEYLVYPSRVKSDEERGYKYHFCSRACKYEWNKTVKGYWEGKKMSDQARKNMSKNHADFSGSKNGRWKGGKRTDKDGYILILKKSHPNSDYHGYIREHRLVMEEKLGRYLSLTEIVHHKNGNKQDNTIQNLALLANASEHTKLGWEIGQYDKLKKSEGFRCGCGESKFYAKNKCKRCYTLAWENTKTT